ncbi:unnamed protein product, partial [Ectocarpus sp. 12 AP-2014]
SSTSGSAFSDEGLGNPGGESGGGRVGTERQGMRHAAPGFGSRQRVTDDKNDHRPPSEATDVSLEGGDESEADDFGVAAAVLLQD